MNKSLRITDGGHLLDSRTERFLPENFEFTSEQLFRARVVVTLCFAIAFFGPLYAAVVYFLTSSVGQAAAICVATVCVVSTPFMMRKGTSFVFLGNWLTLCGYGLILFLATQSLGQSVMMWQVVFAVLGGLIAGKRSAIFWVITMSITTAYFYLSMIASAPSEGLLFSELQILWEMILIIGMFAAIMVLTFSYEGVKDWALDQVRKKEAQTRAILDAAPDGIITLSSDGRVAGFNPAAEALFQYQTGSAEWAPFSVLVPGIEKAPAEAVDPEIEELADGKVFDIEERQSSGPGGLDAWVGSARETEAIRKGGERFPAEVSVTRIEDDDRFVAVLRDITERKEAQRELREARDKAVEANEAKSRFLANISHELRTPLNAVIGYSELVCDDLEDLDQPEIRSDVQKIGVAGKHLLTLINEILDLAKVESGKMDLFIEEIGVSELVEEIADTFTPILAKNNNTLRVDTADAPTVMRVDQMKLRQILINLLSNASKFTDGNLVRLNVFDENREGQEVVIFEVIDRGMGIADDKIEELFEAFKQADETTTREFGGTGLGLTICRHFAELMGGKIEVESQLGEGSTFRVTLPVHFHKNSDRKEKFFEDAPAALEEISAARLKASLSGAPRVLVIDDDPTVHQLMERFLTREGFEVRTCRGGENFLESVRSCNPDIITLDVLMPEINGWSILQQLKADEQLSHIPVVMLTIVNERNMGFSLGATDYLTKPVDPERLAGVLNSHLGEANCRPVMIAEDDEATRDVLRRIVEKSGWQTVCACDGREALDHLDDGVEPCAILLDLMMPRLDGFELLDELRNRRKETDIPVIVVSAADLSEAERTMLDENVDKILAKGDYAREQLVAELRVALNRPV